MSTLTIGTSLPVLRTALNSVLHAGVFTETMVRAWLRHNVEEVSLLEHVIPLIYSGDGRG